MSNRILAAVWVATLLSSAASAEPRPAVIELFTSQGCSSCPPAEALLGELAQRPDVIALAFHVDYWDDLGWRDRFALPEAVQRQQRYAVVLKLSGVFTPQALIDGNRSIVGSNRDAIVAALHNARSGVPVEAQLGNDALDIKLDAQTVREAFDVVLVAYLPQADTRIPRGENAGRTLTEFNIVRAYRLLGAWNGAAAEFKVPLASLPQDASRAAILLQHTGQKAIAGAAIVALR